MAWYSRLQNLFQDCRLSRELDAELHFHLAETVDHLVAEGMTEQDAWAAARRRFGNYSLQKEKTRDMNITRWLDSLRSDLFFALRQLRLNPGFAAVAVLSLALGIGANTAIFQLLDSLRLRGLPVKDPSELAAVDTAPDFLTAGSFTARNRAFTSDQLRALSEHQQAFSDMLMFNNTRLDLSTGGASRFAEGLYVSANFLKLLGISPLIGRDFSGEESQLTCSSPGAILNYAFWQREFGADLHVLGKTVSLNGHRFPVIGVTPASFFGVEPGQRFDVALPLCADNLFAKGGKGRAFHATAYWLSAIGRLKPGWTVARASSHLANVSPAICRESLPSEYPPPMAKIYLKNKLRVVSASAGLSPLRRAFENPLWMLMGLTGLVLLIACANLANLLLARASVREREMAVRLAMGASRSRLLVQLLLESLLLAFGGAALGAVLAEMLSRTLVLLLQNSNNRLELVLAFDWRLFLFTGALAVFTCLLFGLTPALRASGAAPANAMRGGRGSSVTRERNQLRRALVVSQVALSFVLLVAALLFGRSFQKLIGNVLGFDSQNVLVAGITANSPALSNPQRREELFREVQERMEGLHGVKSVAPVLFSPFAGFRWNDRVHSDSDGARTGGKEVWFNRTGPRYLATMGIPLIAGREFNPHDDRHAPTVAIINQTLARQLFPGQNPIGRSFRSEPFAGEPDAVYQIVGIMADTKYDDLHEKQLAIAYLPVAQNPETDEARTFVIRANRPLDSLALEVTRQATAINPTLLVDTRVLAVQIRESVARERLMAHLTTGFGILAACLSALGLYGVMSYLAARRRTEIGIRLALGATRPKVFSLILKDASAMVLIGLAAGLVASLFLARYAEALLFGVKGRDPVSLVAALLLLTATAIGATLLPASRAAHLEPVDALREE